MTLSDINPVNARFTMRMDTELYERLKQAAYVHKRSIAKELEYIAEQYLNSTLKTE